eukprot:s576_g34.t1
MLQNTRERTVFAFQPKRLPKDVDRLRFFQGSIVRKKSLGARGDTDDEEEGAKVSKIEDGSRRGQTQTLEFPDGQTPVRSARAASRSASVNDLRTTVLKEREREIDEGSTSAKDPSPRRLHACVSMSSMPSARRSEVPPPLPAFPGAWKIQAPRVGNQTDRGTSAEAKRSEGKPQVVAAAGKALLAAALEESEPVQKTGMLRSPSMPLPRRPSVPREKRRPRPQRASEEVYEVESACDSGASPSSGGTSWRARAEARAEGGQSQKDGPGRDETDHCPDCPPSLSTSASSQEPQVSRAPLPPPLPTVPPVPLRQFQGYSSTTLVEAASAQAALLSPAPSTRRSSGCE